MNDSTSTINPIHPSLLEKARTMRGKQVTQNANEEYEETITLGDRLSDKFSEIAGSWAFIIFFATVIISWVLLNSFILTTSFDPFPCVFLNLMLSMLAALQAPVIMMSQNRQSNKDRLNADLDYHVNLKAEAEIATIHHEIDLLGQVKWADLVTIQQEQIRLLETIIDQLTSNSPEEKQPID